MPRHAPRKRFGQHFLADPDAAERIFAALNLAASDRVLEIGPGGGALTVRLCAEAGAVCAVEIDRDLAALLAARLPSLRVVCADVLQTDLDALLDELAADAAAAGTTAGGAGEDAGTPRIRIVGNLPYNIATPLLDRLFGACRRVFDIHVMLQAELAARLAAAPGSKAYGRLSVLAQYHCRVDPLFGLEPHSFSPPPKVQSAFVRVVARPRLPARDEQALRHVLRIAFAQRRKVLANALDSLLPDGVDWQAIDIDPGLRAENLSVLDFVAIANHFAARRAETARAKVTTARTGP